MLTKLEAIKAGRKRGLSAAFWVFGGNTPNGTYELFLTGVLEGDPSVMDAYAAPSWLSGEWAGESIPELLGECRNKRDEERRDAVIDAYIHAADDAYWCELERVALLHTGGGKRDQ